MNILSLCTSAGLWDKAYIEKGFNIIPGCEIIGYKREIYRDFCQRKKHLTNDIKNLSRIIKGQHFDGIIGGIPCQSRSILKSLHVPKFGDLLYYVLEILNSCTWNWALFENISALDIPEFNKIRLNAMNFGKPHQSRPRWFTYSNNLELPQPVYEGNINTLFAYPGVYGKLYGTKRASVLQGWDNFHELDFPYLQLQESLADGVPRCLADAWINKLI